MGDVAQQGRTVLFVSHNMSSILRLTKEAIVLEKGRIVMRAPSAEAVDYYLSAGNARAGERNATPAPASSVTTSPSPPLSPLSPPLSLLLSDPSSPEPLLLLPLTVAFSSLQLTSGRANTSW